MDNELFNDLCASVEEAGAHLRGEEDFQEEQIRFVGEPNPRAVRNRLGLTQDGFADLLEISVSTLRNWEQGRREPGQAAQTLLKVAAHNPTALLYVKQQYRTQKRGHNKHGVLIPLPYTQKTDTADPFRHRKTAGRKMSYSGEVSSMESEAPRSYGDMA